MPLMSDSVVVAAGLNSGNVLVGRMFEYVPKEYRKGAAVQLLACASALGGKVSFRIGSQLYADNELVSGDNKFPVFPDHKVVTHGAAPNAHMFMNFQNPTGAPVTFYWKLDIEPV